MSTEQQPRPSDADLLQRLCDGDADALEELHTRYYTRIYRAVYVRLESADDAADVTQDTFLKALEHIDGVVIGENGSLFPWLYTIARNSIVDLKRSGSREKLVSLEGQIAGEFRSLLDLIPNGRPTPDHLLETHEVQAVVRRAIRALPQSQYTAIVYRYLGGLPLAEIGEEMGKSVPAVKSILHRGLENLKTKLTDWSVEGREAVSHDRRTRTERDSRATVEVRR